MSKKKKAKKSIKKSSSVLEYLPIDSRLIPDIFAFGHVKGIARVFLEIEIILATLIVLGTIILIFIDLF